MDKGDAAPMFQLAFSLILRDKLFNLQGWPECYDPDFTSVDKALLHSLDYKVCNQALCPIPQGCPCESTFLNRALVGLSVSVVTLLSGSC